MQISSTKSNSLLELASTPAVTDFLVRADVISLQCSSRWQQNVTSDITGSAYCIRARESNINVNILTPYSSNITHESILGAFSPKIVDLKFAGSARVQELNEQYDREEQEHRNRMYHQQHAYKIANNDDDVVMDGAQSDSDWASDQNNDDVSVATSMFVEICSLDGVTGSYVGYGGGTPSEGSEVESDEDTSCSVSASSLLSGGGVPRLGRKRRSSSYTSYSSQEGDCWSVHGSDRDHQRPDSGLDSIVVCDAANPIEVLCGASANMRYKPNNSEYGNDDLCEELSLAGNVSVSSYNASTTNADGGDTSGHSHQKQSVSECDDSELNNPYWTSPRSVTSYDSSSSTAYTNGGGDTFYIGSGGNTSLERQSPSIVSAGTTTTGRGRKKMRALKRQKKV